MDYFEQERDELNQLILKDEQTTPIKSKDFRTLSVHERVEALVASVNEGLPAERKVLLGDTFTVAKRSIHNHMLVLNSEMRTFKVMRDVEAFIHANITGEMREASVSYDDLLSVGNPSSASPELSWIEYDDLLQAQSAWFASDTRISEEHRTLVASAFLAPKDSIERKFAIARMEALGAPQIPVDVVLSAMSYEL